MTVPLIAMRILTWNTRGLGNPWSVRNLRELLSKKDPEVVFLQETKVLASYFDTCKFSFDFSNCLEVDPAGLGGGLAWPYFGNKIQRLKLYNTLAISYIVKSLRRLIVLSNGKFWEFMGTLKLNVETRLEKLSNCFVRA